MNSAISKFSILAITIITLTSCWTSKVYQISTIKSNNCSDNLVLENDTIRLDFNFSKCGGKLDFTITNKTNTAIFIDWAHSNFIFNNLSFNYFDNTQTIKNLGVYSLSKFDLFDNNVYYESTSKISKEETSVQIPPKSFIKAKIIPLDFPILKQKKEFLNKSFNENNSILKMRVYLAYSKNKNLDSLNYIDTGFWVQNIMDVKEKEFKKINNNQFYNTYDKIDKKKSLFLGIGLFATIIFILTKS